MFKIAKFEFKGKQYTIAYGQNVPSCDPLNHINLNIYFIIIKSMYYLLYIFEQVQVGANISHLLPKNLTY